MNTNLLVGYLLMTFSPVKNAPLENDCSQLRKFSLSCFSPDFFISFQVDCKLILPIPMMTLLASCKFAAGKQNLIKEVLVVSQPGTPMRTVCTSFKQQQYWLVGCCRYLPLPLPEYENLISNETKKTKNLTSTHLIRNFRVSFPHRRGIIVS